MNPCITPIRPSATKKIRRAILLFASLLRTSRSSAPSDRHSGTVNSSPCVRAHGAVRTEDDGHRRGCDRKSDTAVCATNLTWFLSRKRRGSGCSSWLSSMPLATDVLAAGSGDRRSTGEDSWNADKTGDNGASPMSAVVLNEASLASKGCDEPENRRCKPSVRFRSESPADVVGMRRKSDRFQRSRPPYLACRA